MFHFYVYFVVLKDWHIDGSLPLSGFTPTCRTKSVGIDDVAYFSHPFEFDLYYKNENGQNDGIFINQFEC